MSPQKSATLSIGLAILVLTGGDALAQGTVDNPVSEEARSVERPAEVAKIDVHIKVTTTDGRPLPPNSKVEISGQEAACGVLSSNDQFATIDARGEAVFRDIPACKVTIKINISLYVFLRKAVDLANFTSPITLSLEPE